MNAAQGLSATIQRLKLAQTLGFGSYVTQTVSEQLLDHLERTNSLDEDGRHVMRLGCKVAVIEDGGHERPTRRKGSSSAERAYATAQMSIYEMGYLDEEIAILDGPFASRKERGKCDLDELLASIDIRNKLSDAIRASADLDRRLIDRHPEWFDERRTTTEEMLARDYDAEGYAA